LQGRLAEQVESARGQIQVFVETAVAKLKEGATETAEWNADNLRAQVQQRLDSEMQQRLAALREAANGIAAETEQRIHSMAMHSRWIAGAHDARGRSNPSRGRNGGAAGPLCCAAWEYP